MFGKPWVLQLVLYLVVGVLGIVLGPILLENITGTAFSSAVQLPSGEVAAPEATLATHSCTPTEVGAFEDRVHVRCLVGAEAGGAIVYFATPTSDTQTANRYLSVLLTAQAAGMNVLIRYSADDDGSSFNCALVDCRPILNVVLVN